MRETILLVEDNADDADLITLALKKAGEVFSVQIARDGEIAMHYLKGEGTFADRERYPRPRWIITDLKMPKVSGLELLRWIRSNPDYQTVPTLILSSSGRQEDIIEAYQCGASSYFVKPCEFEEMVSLFRTLGDYWNRARKPPLG